MTDENEKPDVERDRPPGEPRSWELREEPTVVSEKKWARLAKVLLYSVWITLLVIAIVVIIFLTLNPDRLDSTGSSTGSPSHEGGYGSSSWADVAAVVKPWMRSSKEASL